jgi:peptidoglycan L-alanyl-D-glutamate endopeptidase CwlK
MGKSLDELSPEFRPLAERLLQLAADAGIPVRVISTGRTREEQERFIKAGTSWTRNSRHLTGHAIDIAPEELLTEKLWAPKSPLWYRLGEIGESLGLIWGGRWRQRDMCHFERPKPKTLT